MAVIYLFDHNKNLRKPLREGVQEIIHNEGEYEAVTQILAKDAPAYGDYFGFRCADGRFRLFWIKAVETDDAAGVCMLTGTDAAIAELNTSILTELPMQNTTTGKVVAEALKGTGWTIGTQTSDGQVNTESAYFATRWDVIKTAAALGKVRALAYYRFEGNQITGKVVDLIAKTNEFSGLIYTQRRGAENIHISREGVPYGRVYAVGKIIGSTNPPEQVTIADAEWSTAKGDPTNKPKGQLYVDLPNALSTAEYVFEDKKEADPQKLLEKAFEDLQKTGKPTVTGTANLSDMARMPGYEHMDAQMWMTAVIRAKNGETVETTIINIERYYVHTELTKITVGDEKSNADMLESILATMTEELLDTAKVAGGGSAGAGEAKQMILNAEELIQLNSQRIEANAEEILLRAFTADVQKLADQTVTMLNEAYVDINSNRVAIAANKTAVDNVGNEVSRVSAELVVQAGEISAKVDADGVIAAINLTPEVAVIQAKRINLSGYVTMNNFQAEMASIDNIFAGYSEISALGINGNLYAKNANFTNNLRLFDYYTEWKTQPIYKGGKITVGGTTSYLCYDFSGNPIGSVRGIPSSWSFSQYKDGEIVFLGRTVD